MEEIQNVKPSISQDVVVEISVAILIILFSVQRSDAFFVCVHMVAAAYRRQ